MDPETLERLRGLGYVNLQSRPEMKFSEVRRVKILTLSRILVAVAAIGACLAASTDALAYVGPGAGLSIVGSVLAFLAAIVAGIIGFLWFPI